MKLRQQQACLRVPQGGKTLLNGVPPEQLGVPKWRTQVQLPAEQHPYELLPAIHSDYSAVGSEAAARCLSCMLACEAVLRGRPL